MFNNVPHEKILRRSLQNGGEFADLFFESTHAVKIVAGDHKIETATEGDDTGAGLRVISGHNNAYGYTNEVTSKGLKQLAGEISATVRGEAYNRTIHLKRKGRLRKYNIKRPPEKISLDKKVNLVREAEKMAWGTDPRIVQVKVSYSDVLRKMGTANSWGETTAHQTVLVTFSVEVTASNGREFFRGYDSMGGHLGHELFDEESLETVVRKAVKRALNNLTAGRAQGGTMPVVISFEAGGTMVHEAVGHGLEADLACQGLSVYEGRIGEKVASDLVTVVDDPTYPKKRGTYLFDDEGVAAQRVVLIERGILKSYLYDRLTAMKMKTNSNAHGRRESYAHRPIVRMTNTMILPGRHDPAEIVRSVDKGLLVTMMGGGEVNTVNGDFVFEVAEGYQIEHGKVGEPVRGATLTGNCLEVMKSIDRVGSDLGFSIGTCGKDGQHAPVADAMPTIRIPEMVVGGVV